MGPVIYPKVTINGATYEVKYEMGAIFRLERFGIDSRNAGVAMAEEIKGGRNVMLMFKLLAAGIGHTLKVEPEDLADMIPQSDFKDICDAITAAWVKAPPPDARAALIPVAAQGPTQ